MHITKLRFWRQQRKTTKIVPDTTPNEFLLTKFIATEITESFVPHTESGFPENRLGDQKKHPDIDKRTE